MKDIKTIAELKEYLGWDDEVVLDWFVNWNGEDDNFKMEDLKKYIGTPKEEEFCECVLSFKKEKKL